MTSATTSLIKPLRLSSVPKYCTSTISSTPFLSLPSKPIRLIHLSSSWVPHKSKNSRSILAPLVAQTSDWAQQEEESGGGSVVEVQLEAEAEAEATVGEETVEEESAAVAEDGEEEAEEEDSYPEPPEEAKLFVGNLPYDFGSEQLAGLFNQAGVVEIAEVIYNRQTNQSRGFGFVSMSTVEEAEKAIEMFNRYDLSGRLLTVNKASPKGSQPERPPRVYEPSFRIYVGNLPWQVDSDRLQEVFSEHGKVVDARVVSDRETGRSRGFGFVTMSSETELNDAIAALDGQSLDGRAIRVNVAEERPRRSFF